jgi:glycosyltransferase involved in cell wall biosynthesis
MNIVHLTASTFYGGPERQMLGLAAALPAGDRTAFVSFAEGGRCRPFLKRAREQGCEAVALAHDTPHLRAAARELTGLLGRLGADVLCCHGYKANLLGRVAARRRGIPAVAVARGWTGESLRVRLYEALDRLHLRWMDRVVCVSEAQAAKVRRCGVRAGKVEVIHNAIDVERFADPDPLYRTKLERLFRRPRTHLIGAAGRLSPEKGFDVLVAAAERVVRADGSVGFVLFGEGACRPRLVRQVNEAGLGGAFVLSGFRADLDRFLPYLDLFVLPSYTEGLPNVVLEAFAAGVPVVATAVGGTPEVVEDGVGGYLVPPGDPNALAGRILDALASEDRLRDMALHGRQCVLERFAFAAQARRYRRLFEQLLAGQAGRSADGSTAPRRDSECPAAGAAPSSRAGELVSTGEVRR